MNELDRHELERLKQQQRYLLDDLTALGERLAKFEARLQSTDRPTASPVALPIQPLAIEPIPEVLKAPTPAPHPVVPAPEPARESTVGALLRAMAPAETSREIPPVISTVPQVRIVEPQSESSPQTPPAQTELQPASQPDVQPIAESAAQPESRFLKGLCGSCHQPLEFLAQELGRTIRCPHCEEQTELQVPSTASEPVPEVIPIPPTLTYATPVRPARRLEPVLATADSGPATDGGSFEMRLGTYWFVRIGVVLLLTALGFAGFYAYKHYVPHLGAGGKVGMLYLASGALLGIGAWFQRQNGQESLRQYGRVIMAGGLAAVYFTTYAAHHIPNLRVISSALVDGALLLGWASFMVWLADRKQSEVLALFAIGLAWYTSLVTRVGVFTLYSNLLLTLAAVFFLIRNQWATLSFVSLVGTYAAYGYWRFYQNGVWLMDLGASPELLWHGITLLGGYWVAFTAAVFFSREERLSGGSRLTFLSFNNGAFFGLTVASMYSSHSGGFWKFCLVFGAVLLALAWAARIRLPNDEQARGGYLTQGILLITVGLIAKYTGMRLGLMLAVESVTLLILGHWRQNRLLLFGAHVVGAMAVGWGIDGTERFDRTTLVLGTTIGVFMAFNAYWASRRETEGSGPIRLSPGFFSVLATILWLVVTWANVSRENLPPVLAVEALVLTALIYASRTPELTLCGQVNLLLAQGLWLVDAAQAQGSERPWWNPAIVLATSVALGHWWQRQRVLVVEASFVRLVEGFYSLAAVGVLHFWLRPLFRDEVWLATSALLAAGLTLYGLATRAWPLAACGQLFIAVAGWQFVRQLGDGQPGWGYALVPMAVLLAMGAAVVTFLNRRAPDSEWLDPVRRVAILYRAAAVLMAIAWVHEYLPAHHRFWVLALVGAMAFAVNGWRQNIEGLALSGALSAAGLCTFVFQHDDGAGFHLPSLLAIVLILSQQQALRRWPDRFLLPSVWNDVIIVVGGLALGLFTTRWIGPHGTKYLPLTWSVLALVLAVAGAAMRERTYGWLNLAAIGAGLGLFSFLAVDDSTGVRSVYAGHLAPILLLMVEQHVARRFQDRLNLEESWHQAMILVAGLTTWLFVTRALHVHSGGSLLTVGWAVLGFLFLLLGFVVHERMHRWVGLAVLALALGRVAVFDFWKLDTVYQILSALALGLVLVVLGFIYNRYQETIRKWL